jgi:hypothetical protein
MQLRQCTTSVLPIAAVPSVHNGVGTTKLGTANGCTTSHGARTVHRPTAHDKNNCEPSYVTCQCTECHCLVVTTVHINKRHYSTELNVILKHC